MNDKERYDNYASELARRFEDFTKWAIANWPDRNFPLVQSDFKQSRRELGWIIGPKLGEGGANPPSPATDKGPPSYINVTPTPWP